MVSFKKKCMRCNKNYVLATNKTGYVVCFECQEKQMHGEIADPAMKEMFDIPASFYKDSMFLRDIKIKYLQYGSLSERQVEAFKNTVERFKEEAVEVAQSDEGTSEDLPVSSKKEKKK